ncbi:flavodoxin family protein [Moorella sp. E306M]|uniref:flavodoxin family protein n=1 Tax=Moorella sp. E306M TaxID=2572683 RepID=UPI001143E587|nr:flavodoxin family protein [Moorella sp. E306M]
MKILGVVGSNRKHGNTSGLVKAALQAAEKENADTSTNFSRDYLIQDCVGCEGSKDTMRCAIKDDMQKLYPLLLEADGIILGSPTYFYNITSTMKAFIDRCYCFEAFAGDDQASWDALHEALGIKYAVVIAVCEQHDEADMGFTAEAMIKPLEALGYRIISTIKAIGYFKAGEALQDERAVEDARNAGKRLARTISLRKEVEKMQQ